MLGYIVWTTDRLASLAGPEPPQQTQRQSGPPSPAAALATARTPDRGPYHAATGGARHRGTRHDQAGRPVLAPKLAACGKIAMSITMGYMLILML